MDPAIIQKEALLLSEAERALLADRLLSSLENISEEIRESWVRESESRVEAYRAGKIEAVVGPTSLEDLKKKLRSLI